MQSRATIALLIAIAATVFSGVNTASTPTVFVRVTFKMTWARFCYLDDLFRDRFAILLINDKGRITKPSEIIIMNYDNECSTHLKRRGNDHQAKVELYIVKPGGSNDSVDIKMTNKAFQILYYLMDNSNMLQVDKVFQTKVAKVESVGERAERPPSGSTEMEKTWIAIAIGLGVVTLFVLVYVLVVARRKGKEIRERVQIFYSKKQEIARQTSIIIDTLAPPPSEPQDNGKINHACVEIHHDAKEKEDSLDEKL